MSKLNCRAKLAARMLLTGWTQTMGLALPDLVHASFAEIAKALARRLYEEGRRDHAAPCV